MSDQKRAKHYAMPKGLAADIERLKEQHMAAIGNVAVLMEILASGEAYTGEAYVEEAEARTYNDGTTIRRVTLNSAAFRTFVNMAQTHDIAIEQSNVDGTVTLTVHYIPKGN